MNEFHMYTTLGGAYSAVPVLSNQKCALVPILSNQKRATIYVILLLQQRTEQAAILGLPYFTRNISYSLYSIESEKLVTSITTQAHSAI